MSSTPPAASSCSPTRPSSRSPGDKSEIAPFLLKNDAEAYAAKINGKVLGFDDALKAAVSGG